MTRGKRLYPVLHNYFRNWSSNMAYILGFITADGNVCKNKRTLSIDLAAKDIYVLEFIRSNICPAAKLSYRQSVNSYRLRINSTELCNDLCGLGVIPNKTGKEYLPSVPGEFLGDYIRGLFDGDGWVFHRRNSIECGICSASEIYLNQINVALGNMGKVRPKIKKNRINLLYQLDITKNDSIDKFKNIIYKSNGFCLLRKKDKFYSNYHIASESSWTKKDIAFLRENFKPKTKGLLNWLANNLGRTRSSVSLKIWRLGLVNGQC
jgi:hypothetical protein